MASTPVTAPSSSFSESLVQNPSSDSDNNTNSDSSSPSPPSTSTSPPPSKDNNNDDGGGGGDSSGSPPDSSSSDDSSPSPPPPSPSSSPPPSSPPPSPPKSPPPSSPPPSPPKSPPPSDSSPPPSSPSPPPPSPEEKSPSPPPPSDDSTKSPPQTSPSPSPSPPPPSATTPNTPVFSPPEAVPTPPGAEVTPLPPPGTFLPPPPGAVSSVTPPPPGASGGRLSPGGSGSQKPSTSSHSGPQELSTSDLGIIVGIAAGGVILLALVIVCVLCTRKKKTKPYYMDPARPPPGAMQGDYYASAQWASPQDHVVKLPPPPGMMGGPVGGGVGWGATPPPGVNTSGEFSSGFSGPSPTPPNMALGFSKSQFTYDELASATGGFAQSNLLGQGGFGYVHKGVLHDGKEVAVKSLKSGSGQGEREFQAEVEIISRVHHRHLVSLVGYCIADGQRMLVYEFVPNKTLEYHLHGKGQPVMGWQVRLRIALGSAKGLAYLHEDCHPRIIHRDIKAANILLDDNFEAMVADFGLAKLSSENYTHVSTRVMGTFGYLAPEYASSGKLTEKSDVFSFGVMLLELLTGRRPVDTTNRYMEDSLVDWARPLLTKALEDGEYGELVDPRLEGNYDPHEMLSLISCAAASIRHSARRRPKMSQIVRALEGDATLDDLNEGGVKPGQSAMYSTNMDNSYDTGAYNADMMKFRKMVMSSQEFGESSDYGATSEYGLNPSSSSSSEMGNSGPQRQKL